MTIKAAVIADSSSLVNGSRLVTLELVYPRFIHAEVMTHRVFSRNASSSRAIPVERMHKSIIADTASPEEWRMNEAGMQGHTHASPELVEKAGMIMAEARTDAIRHAERLAALGFHKQHVNRLTETFQHIRVVLTSACWENFFTLRLDSAAEPTIYALAVAIHGAMANSTPTVLERGEWHLPYYIPNHEGKVLRLGEVLVARKISAARCARVSYNNFEGKPSSDEEDLALYEKLCTTPLHASPMEHQATPDWVNGFIWANKHEHGNLPGWRQHRKMLANEYSPD